ncbi:MAG: ATP-binding protein, partial [Desulfovermiculus sp.]
MIGDQVRLTQILFNLVGNAVKYTQQGEVSVQVSLIDGRDAGQCRLLFIVSDTGQGIPEDKLEQVFESFQQANEAENPYARRFEGAGLGLPLVKKLLGLMGGNACLLSQAGQGSTVYVSLPFKIPEALQQESREVQKEGRFPRAKARQILVVDDERTIQFYITRVLEKHGCRVTVAENGEQALEELTGNDYDCVLMDVQMPVMDGVEATQRIRASHFEFKDVPIIALTAYAMSGDREKFL